MNASDDTVKRQEETRTGRYLKHFKESKCRIEHHLVNQCESSNHDCLETSHIHHGELGIALFPVENKIKKN